MKTGSTSRTLIGAVAGIVLVLCLGRLVVSLFGGDPYLQRKPETARYLDCTACGERYPVKQQELFRLHRPDGPVDDEGEPLLRCLKCEVEAARAVLEEPHERER